jgi:hypothetical protein
MPRWVIAIAAAALLLGALGTSITGTAPALADVNCGNDHRLRVDLIDDETGDLLAFPGTTVELDPDPIDGAGTRDYVDNGANDDNPAVGRIDEDDACEVTGTGTGPTAYAVQVEELPDDDCELNSADSQSTTLTGNSSVTFPVEDCDPAGVSGIAVAASATSVGCSGTSTITATLTPSNGTVPDGTEVTFSTNAGSVNPTTATTTSNAASTTFTAPASSGGSATITATSMGVSGSTTVTVNCGGGPVAAASLGFPTATCGASTNVTFWWGPNRAGNQWLDLSLVDNNFAAGTFVGAGPIGPEAGSFNWNGLTPGLPHFWRVNTLTAEGWTTSFTGTFVACSGPEIRAATYGCLGGGQAVVQFHWSPSTPSGNGTWLDLSIFNNGWSDSFINAGPMGHDWLNFTWSGILANTTHFWRINTLFGNTFDPSSTGQFTAFC